MELNRLDFHMTDQDARGNEFWAGVVNESRYLSSWAFVHMLIKSRMLEMALNVANLVLGNARARTYFNPDIWESIGRQEVPSFIRRPLAVPGDLKTG